MFKKVNRFINRHIIQGWQIRLLHTTIIGLICLALLTNFFQDLVGITSWGDFVGRIFNPADSNFWSVLAIGIFCFVQFNVSLFVRNWKWDLISVIFSLTILNLTTYAETVIPFRQLAIPSNIFILSNVIFTDLVRLARADREKNFVKQAFKQYVNSELLEDLIANPNQLDLNGEQKHMTVLFADIRGFTSLSERLQPKELIQVLNKYLDEMSRIILKNDGTIDKYIGDAVMAFWNAPMVDRQHVSKAVLTAVEMIQKLEELSMTTPELKGLSIGIGINTGNMVVGNIGSKDHFDYTVLGDNVNLASRLESLTKKYGVNILVSQQTMLKCTESKVIFRQIDQIIVKGKSQDVRIYQPLPATPDHTRLKNLYEQALGLYQRGQFQDALMIFQNLGASDSAARQMANRIVNFEPDQIQNWNGIWEWDQK